MCSIQRLLCSAAVSPMPTTRYLALCKAASMKSNGVPAMRECGWSKLYWAGARVRRARLTGQSWQRKASYEQKSQISKKSQIPNPKSQKNPKLQIPNLKKIPNSKSQMVPRLGGTFGAWVLGFVWDLGFGISHYETAYPRLSLRVPPAY